MHASPAAEDQATSATLAAVSVSGSKESTAALLLALEAHGRKNCRFVFVDTDALKEAKRTKRSRSACVSTKECSGLEPPEEVDK
jgi:3'-phosphoadenosine 5'-phosphosulfate sulfotransferase (PAPS reductase)/FAD synthetase